MNFTQLNQLNISSIAASLSCPEYDRSVIKAGIVHIGVGGFHRSHQAYFIHQLLGETKNSEWGICGIGLREGDRKINEVLKNQNCLYTLITQHSDGKETCEVIGSLLDYIYAVESPNKAIEKMAHPNTKIVSLTITEGGYNLNSNTGDFDFDNPDIQHEIQFPSQPKTVFGFLTAALKKRRDEGLPAFTILSCDNIQHNGDVARKMLLTFAQRQDPSLCNWISNEVAFPNTMVDRITPVTTETTIELLKNNYKIKDDWPVVCENAGHSVLGIPGAIHGHPTINACMEDKIFASFMRQFMDKEATPILGEIEGIDLPAYKNKLEERFANPNIKDGVSRICSESSAKLPKFLIPTIEENLAKGGSIKYGTFIIAAWCYYSDKAVDLNNNELKIIDSRKAELHRYAKEYEHDQLSFLRTPNIFGSLLRNQRFISQEDYLME